MQRPDLCRAGGAVNGRRDTGAMGFCASGSAWLAGAGAAQGHRSEFSGGGSSSCSDPKTVFLKIAEKKEAFDRRVPGFVQELSGCFGFRK